ncbi:hypothetical protein GXP70_16760 [Paenibacillus lycopersici]|uniref:Uncharacterized protein n=1 Tax=Paenibacillus lycopersici TaxID=2704462 RepID=A0A6C0G402_9BACL|nr:hypothetical protein [Paenibacillus lycopersici]QHT61450.1 hypothetical protein GXP70_16760 [Paenibacillus lycopersici]
MNNNPQYYNGHAGNGESIRRIAARLSAPHSLAPQRPSAATAAGAIGDAPFPAYFNGYAGNGESFRRMAMNQQI